MGLIEIGYLDEFIFNIDLEREMIYAGKGSGMELPLFANKLDVGGRRLPFRRFCILRDAAYRWIVTVAQVCKL
jgi:hypothetical protein